jgi:hypothetical protein
MELKSATMLLLIGFGYVMLLGLKLVAASKQWKASGAGPISWEHAYQVSGPLVTAMALFLAMQAQNPSMLVLAFIAISMAGDAFRAYNYHLPSICYFWICFIANCFAALHFFMLVKLHWIMLAVFLTACICMAALYKELSFDRDAERFFMPIYMLVSAAMLALAAEAGWLPLAGVSLYLLSDVYQSLFSFGSWQDNKPVTHRTRIVWPLYSAGCMLIAGSTIV